MQTTKSFTNRLLHSAVIVFIFALASAFIVFLYTDFNTQMDRQFQKNTAATLSESAGSIVNTVKIKSKGVFSSLQTLAACISTYNDMFSHDVISLLKNETSLNSFTSIGVVKRDGSAYYNDGNTLNIADRDYFQAALTGRNTISKLIISRITGRPTLVYAIPLVKNNKIEGVLVATYKSDILNELVALPIFGGRGELYLIQEDGEIVARSNAPSTQSNYFDFLSGSQLSGGSTVKHFQDDLINHRSGMLEYSLGGQELRYAAYEPVGLSSWYLVCAVPASYIKTQTSSVSGLAFQLILKELALLILLFGIVMMIQLYSAKNLADMNEKFEAMVSNVPGGMFCYSADAGSQFDYISEGLLTIFGYSEEEFRMQFKNSFANSIYIKDRERVLDALHRHPDLSSAQQTEYRIECARGDIRWLLGRGRVMTDSFGKRWCYVVVMDITRLKEVQEEVRLSEERYRIVAAQSESMIYEYSAHHGALFHTSLLYKIKFGYPLVQEGFPESFVQQGFVHPDDSQTFLDLYFKSTVKSPSGSVEVRLKKADGSYLWCSVQNTTIFSEDGKPMRYIGGILDIDKRQRETESLKHLAQLDPLTGLYNKTSIQTMVGNCLEAEGGRHALLFIDVDNFKAVNDSLGHLFGDAILSEIAASLKKISGKRNYGGRVGGDEFILFLQNCYDFDEVCQRAEEVCSVFRTYSGDNKHIPISCSIGIAVYPRDGQSYEELAQKADSALYSAKRKGKNRFEFYSSDTKLIQRKNPKPVPIPALAAESNPQHLTTFLFDILNETPDPNSAINLVLNLLGQHFPISRTFINEFLPDSPHDIATTYEWCAAGVTPLEERTLRLSPSAYRSYKAAFNQSGIFYCNDPQQLRNIPFVQSHFRKHDLLSMLHCAVLDNGAFHGSVCFEHSSEHAPWTDHEKITLTFIGKLIGTCLMKLRSREHYQVEYEAAQAVIDHRNLWTYVIDEETKRLLYLSRRTKQDFPNAAVGALCYESMNKGLPCTHCPSRCLTPPASFTSNEKYYSKLYGGWLSYTATRIVWPIGSKNAVVFCFSADSPLRTSLTERE